MNIELHHGDCREKLKLIADNSIDSVVTDPPYELGFMGKKWDNTGIAYDVSLWAEVLRVLKPGGHLLSFGGTRTYHRMACAIEDAGFEIRDQIQWLYGSGFPKSHNISKAMDKGVERKVIGVAGRSGKNRSCMAGDFAGGDYMATAPTTDNAKQWDGWGTALKPANEPIVMARKPFGGTVVDNILKYGTGALNIDASRIPIDPEKDDARLGGNGSWKTDKAAKNVYEGGYSGDDIASSKLGRWAANVIHDGSDEVMEEFSKAGNGSAARFFYCAKTSKKDRDEGIKNAEKPIVTFQTANETSGKASSISEGRNTSYRNTHPTVKPTELMRYLVRMVTPPNGKVLDPFMGSGSTGKAAALEGFDFVGIEREAEYIDIARQRIQKPKSGISEMFE